MERLESIRPARHWSCANIDKWYTNVYGVVMPDERNKTSIHLRVDTDVLEWFKQHGKGHLKRMNAVLRAYVETEKHRHP